MRQKILGLKKSFAHCKIPRSLFVFAAITNKLRPNEITVILVIIHARIDKVKLPRFKDNIWPFFKKIPTPITVEMINITPLKNPIFLWSFLLVVLELNFFVLICLLLLKSIKKI